MEDLKGRRILVTGASTGIGSSVARALASKGAHVAVHYNRSEQEARAVFDQITSAGGQAVLVQGDVSKRGVAAQVVNEAADKLGGLDTLINNAGGIVGRAPFVDIKDELLDDVFDLNVRSVINACQAAIPWLEKAHAGAIINVGSIAGSDGGGAGSATYAGAKAYVHNLTRHLAKDLGPRGIRVNAVAPGVIQTPFHSATPPERMEAMKKATLLGRVGQPEDCDGVFLFLSSPSMSGYITGQIIHLNGGQFLA